MTGYTVYVPDGHAVLVFPVDPLPIEEEQE